MINCALCNKTVITKEMDSTETYLISCSTCGDYYL